MPQAKNLAFCLVFIFALPKTLLAQSASSDALVARSIGDKVIGYYKSRTQLCYTFNEREYFKTSGKRLVSHGTAYCYSENDSLFYRVSHMYDSIADKPASENFEAVLNRKHYGTNDEKNRVYKDHSSKDERSYYYTFNQWPHEILNPVLNLKKLLTDKRYQAHVIVKKEFYVIRFQDTSKISSFSYWEQVVYVSKSDFCITRQVRRKLPNRQDSTVLTYTYKKESFEKTKEYVDNFKPFLGTANRKTEIYTDTLNFIPEFDLRDISGKNPLVSTPYVLLDLWYKDCEPCLQNLNYLDNILSKKLTILSINIRDTIDETIRQIASKHAYPMLFNGQEFAQKINLQGFPSLYIYDTQRRVLFRQIDFANSEALTSFIEKLNAE